MSPRQTLVFTKSAGHKTSDGSILKLSQPFQKGTACRLVVQDGFVTKLFVSEFLPLTSYNAR